MTTTLAKPTGAKVQSRPNLVTAIRATASAAGVPLGFGTARLTHDMRTTPAEVIIAAALDSGIAYFDTARMYGDGLAEGVLAQALGRARERVILASKVGILPPSRSLAMRAARSAVRHLIAAAPAAERFLSPPAASMPRFGVFDVDEMRLSVETSLRELKTDRLDILLLHDCEPEDVTDEVVDLLRTLRNEGKICASGMATSAPAAAKIAREHPSLCEVVQTPAFVGPIVAAGLNITHSVLGARLDRLQAWCDVNPDRFGGLGVDVSDRGALGRLLLASAVRANREGIVLFSSSTPDNIRTNAAMARDLPAVPTEGEQVLDRILVEADASAG